MSFGLQVFSASGTMILDTEKGSLPILDQVPLLASNNFAWSKSYPALVGHTINFQLQPPGASGSYEDAYPTVSVTYPGGIPTIQASKAGSLAFSDWLLTVFALVGPDYSSTFGLEVVSSLDQRQIIVEDTKLLRFRGTVAPQTTNTMAYTGAGAYYWYLTQQGILPSGSPKPYVFLELSPTVYAGITFVFNLSVYGGSAEWAVVAYSSSPSFAPKLSVFTNDMDTLPATNDHGLNIYDSNGALMFNSGRNALPLQIAGSHDVNIPPYGQTLLVNPPPGLPLNCATSHLSSVYNLVGPDLVHYSMLKAEGSGVRVGWIPVHYGYEIPWPRAPFTAFIDQSHYS